MVCYLSSKKDNCRCAIVFFSFDLNLACQMQYIDQKNPAQSVIRHNCDKVVDRCYQRAGRNGRVYMDLLEKQRDTGTNRSGNDHRQYQREADASGHRIGKQECLAFKQCDI